VLPRRFLLLCALLAALPVAVGCGSSSSSGSGSGGGSRPSLTVSAATSLKSAFTAYGERFAAADARFSFAGSDELAAQIQQGVKPDVFAAANTKLPDALYAKKLVGKPVVFAANRLVLAVGKGSPISSLDDLAKPGHKLVIGSASVPIGSYTRQVLAKLPGEQSERILAQVRSNEPDVGGIVGKLTQGAADAGFVYVTDVRATQGALKAIELPAAVQPRVAYGVAVVQGAKHPKQAQAFVNGLLGGAGRDELRKAGFEPPPGA
jgi:molybdate transport system substrate-binding protein